MLINRDTEKIIFHPPAYIRFRLNVESARGMVVFNPEAVKQMNLKLGGYVEFELDGKTWLVHKTDKENGFKLFTVGRKNAKALAINTNKVVRGFLAAHNRQSDVWVRARLEKLDGGKYDYWQFKICL